MVAAVCANIETKGISWKLPLPAYSGSTPIIWGETIFLNVATGTNTGELELWAVDRTKQTVAWKRRIADSNHKERDCDQRQTAPPVGAVDGLPDFRLAIREVALERFHPL